MGVLDKKIERDMELYVDGPVRQRIRDVKETVAIWTAAYEVVQTGSFGRIAQEQFCSMFGEETFEKLRNFLSGLDASDAVDETLSKLEESRHALEVLIPANFTREIRLIQAKVSRQLEGH